MNNNTKIVIGIFLFISGLLWLFSSLGTTIISISGLIKAFFIVWPLILVVIGIKLIFRDNRLINISSGVIFLLILLILSTALTAEKPSKIKQQFRQNNQYDFLTKDENKQNKQLNQNNNVDK